jgi:hypothetical protein
MCHHHRPPALLSYRYRNNYFSSHPPNHFFQQKSEWVCIKKAFTTRRTDDIITHPNNLATPVAFVDLAAHVCIRACQACLYLFPRILSSNPPHCVLGSWNSVCLIITIITFSFTPTVSYLLLCSPHPLILCFIPGARRTYSIFYLCSFSLPLYFTPTSPQCIKYSPGLLPLFSHRISSNLHGSLCIIHGLGFAISIFFSFSR